MRTLTRHAGVMACTMVASALGLFLLGFGPSWARPAFIPIAAYSAVVLMVGIGPLLASRRSIAGDTATVTLSFVGTLAALLLFGPAAMTLAATVGAVGRHLIEAPRAHPVRRVTVDLAAAIAAAQAAALAHAALGGTLAPLVWPWQGLPIAGAVVTYCIVTSCASDVLLPLVSGAPIARSWPRHALRACPNHFVVAGLAVGLVEVLEHRAWEVLLVGALPLYFAWRAYASRSDHHGSQVHRLDVAASSDHGVAILDTSGRVILWNGALAEITDCTSEEAAGRSLAEAVPALAQSDLAGAIRDCLTTRTPRTIPELGLKARHGVRILHVTILPDVDGVMLVWRDVSAQAETEARLKRTAERLALVAAGANDGLWELDERTQALYMSARWRSLVGLPPLDSTGTAAEWFERVHPDDVAGLKAALAGNGATPDQIEHEHRIRHENGAYRRVLCSGVAVRESNRRITRIAGSLTDITEKAIAREHILSSGARDSLTGLRNRAAFVEGLGQSLAELKQRRGGRFATLYLDLDRFKVVNDSLGHMVGDELLVEVSRRLEACLRPGDTIARLGGDEFAILLHGLGDETQANVVAFRIQEALAKPFAIGGREVVTSASIGIAFSRSDYTNPEEIVRDADTAMYHAKAHGKARHELFDADMHARALDRLGLESDLRVAVRSRDFEVHYQPIVSLDSRMCTGFEALIRWQRNGRAVPPGDFIPLAEELGLIESLGAWVLQESCRTFAEWQQRFADRALDCITVNVSTRQLMQQGFVYFVEQTVQQSGLRPCDLRLEITETALMDAPQLAAEVLRNLRTFGVKIYLDDFGTGFSSLSHLHKLPVDALKIDRSFVSGLMLDDRPAIVESIVAVARTLKTDVVAEGVEHESQARKLEQLGCRQAQGYLFSAPLSAEAVEALLTANRPLPVGQGLSSGRPPSGIRRPAPVTPTEPLKWPAPARGRGVAV